jgi:hypothetical protein
MRIFGIIVLVLVALGGAAFGYLTLRKPAQAPPSEVRVESTPARLERGKYLFENLAGCDDCHSQRDWSRFGAPVVPGGRGKGFVFPPEMGLPGAVTAPNITPDPETGIGAWTDGEKIRAIRDGVDRNGNSLFPMMPYPYYRSMSDEDVYSVVAYLNTLPPVKNSVPRSKLDFPVNLMIKSVPQPVGQVGEPDRNNTIKYGEYLAAIGGCSECHTEFERGEIKKDKLFAGGREFRIGKFVTMSANITPDEASGTGKWTEERFLSKFHGYQSFADGEPPKANQSNFTLMPWLGLAKLPDEDLKKIYAYLRTQKAVYNPVDCHPAQALGQ